MALVIVTVLFVPETMMGVETFAQLVLDKSGRFWRAYPLELVVHETARWVAPN